MPIKHISGYGEKLLSNWKRAGDALCMTRPQTYWEINGIGQSPLLPLGTAETTGSITSVGRLQDTAHQLVEVREERILVPAHEIPAHEILATTQATRPERP